MTSLSRTLDAYATLQKSELNSSKKEKAGERLATFRAELADYKTQYAALRERNDAVQLNADRGELLGRRPHGAGGAGTPDNPYNNSKASSSVAPPPNVSTMGSSDVTRESHALREQNFFTNTHSTLDEYLQRGQAVLGDLAQQREVLKGTQRRLYSVANTLGVSGETIRMVERRAKQDKWIFWVGCVVFFSFCYLCLRWLR